MRSLRMLVLGACVLASACYQGSCDPTGPSETASSGPARTIAVGIQYSIATGEIPTWVPDVELVIAAGRAGAHAVPIQTQRVVSVEGVRANDVFEVAARGAFLGTCSWNGVSRSVVVDLSIVVRPHVSTPNTYVLSCN